MLEATTTTAPATDAPTTSVAATTLAATSAPPATTTTSAPELVSTTVAEIDANVTDSTAAPGPQYKVKTTISCEISIDLTALDDAQKTGVAHGLAYGLHHSACKSVSSMWDTLSNCFLGNGLNDTSFSMVMNLDSQLVATQPTVSEYMSARRLSAVTLSNAGDFSVVAADSAVVAAAADSIQDAVTSGDLTGDKIKGALTSALQARASVIGEAALNATLEAVASAVVSASAGTVETVGVSATSAPATSGASATGVSMVRAGLLAAIGSTVLLA